MRQWRPTFFLLAALVLGSAAAAAASTDESRVFAGAAECRAVVEGERGRMAERAPETLRIAAWNIAWFPDHTDVGWLACTIAWMSLDLLGVAEMRDTPAARARLKELLAELERLTGAPWQSDLQRCGAPLSQHVGFLWNARRLRLAASDDAWALNARARGPEQPCAGWLRPARHGYFLPAEGGAGFHALVVHLKSGADPAAAAERAGALARLAQATASFAADGARVVLLGDFNSMGDGRRGSAAAEVRGLLSLAAARGLGLGQAGAPACSEYYRGRGGRLDQVLASSSLGSIAPGGAAVSGYCAVARCAPITPWRLAERPAAYRSLSDHCPVVVEIQGAMAGGVGAEALSRPQPR